MPFLGSTTGKSTFVNTSESNTWRDNSRINNLLAATWKADSYGLNVPGYFAGLEYDLILEKNPWIYASINAISRAVIQLPVRSLTSGSGTFESVDPDSEHARFVQSPTRECNLTEYWDWKITTLLAHGRTVSFIERFESGRIRSLKRIHPARLAYLKSDPRTGNAVPVGWYILGDEGEYMKVDRRDLFMVSLPSTRNLRHALSPLEPLRETIENDERARLAMSAIWRNGGRPSFVLKHPGRFSEANPNAIEGLAKQFSKKHAGVENWGAPLILEEGMDAHPLTVDSGIDYASARLMSRTETVAVLGITGSLLGITEGSTYSNVSESEDSLYRRVLPPYLQMIESAWSFDVVDGSHEELAEPNFPGNPKLEFWVDGVLRGSAQERAQDNALAIQNGWRTPNEARIRERQEPIEGGDELLINQALTPIDQLTQNRMPSDTSGSDDEVKAADVNAMIAQLSRLKVVGDVDLNKLVAVTDDEGLKSRVTAIVLGMDAGTGIKSLRERLKDESQRTSG